MKLIFNDVGKQNKLEYYQSSTVYYQWKIDPKKQLKVSHA